MKFEIKVNPGAVRKHTINIAVSVLRLFLFVTLAFVILYPVLTQISASFMSVSDVYNSTVQYLPKNFTPKQTEEYILKALEYYQRYRERMKERGDR